MIRFIFIVHFILWIVPLVSQSPVGIWKTIDDETGKAQAHVSIYEKEGKLYGKIDKLLVPTDREVCDFCRGINKNKPFLGMLVIYNMVKKGEEWIGRVYKADLGMEFKGSMELLSKDKLKVTGRYLFISRSQIWERIN